MHPLSRVLLMVSLLTLISNGSAQKSSTSTSVPNLIRYGGVLKDAKGAAMASRTVGITFLIYGQQDGGAPVWLETQNVATDAAGQYNVLLGSTAATGLPSDLFAQQEQRWLAVKAEGQPEQPRVLLVSVPYAMKAGEADRLAGHSVSEFVTTDSLQSAVQQLQGQAPAGSSGVPAGANGKNMAAGNAPVITNPATNFVDNTTNQVVLVQQNGTGVGLKASSPSNVGVLGTVSSTAKAGIVAGVEGTSTINNGYGMFGYSTAATGGIGAQGRSDSSNGIGVRGFTIGTSGVAVSALSNATSGSPIGLLSSISAPGGTGALITNVAAGTVTGPLISATTNAGTLFTVGGNGNVSAAGSMSGKQLISTVATGTAPLQVASTTLVPNLNASLLGGNAASTFAVASGSPNYIQNGTAVQPGSSFNISGTGTATSFNSVTSYHIGGGSVLSIGSGSVLDFNLFLGVGAGYNNLAGAGQANTFAGYQTGLNNTIGGYNALYGVQAGFSNVDGHDNSFYGAGAGYSNTSGIANTFSGSFAGFSNTGSYNTFTGYVAGQFNTTGVENTFSGSFAGYSNTAGAYNTFTGYQAGYSNTTGGDSNTFTGSQAGYSNSRGFANTFIGNGAGSENTSGDSNTFIGSTAGFKNTVGHDDVYIANFGPASGTESNTIRIGYPAYQSAAYIAGIYGSSVGGNGIGVYVDSNGQLGTTVSSRRFKEQIRDMGDSTNGLMKLRPVTFLYKPEYDKGPRTLQYGLIAEEVAEVYPDLVAYEPDGKPYTVKYQYLTTMLLNEMQKQYHRAETQEQNMKAQSEVIQTQEQNIQTQTEVMHAQQQEIDGLKAQLRLQNAAFQERLSRLESMIERQTQTALK